MNGKEFCKHYHGMSQPCAVGVDYETVKVRRKTGGFDVPCWDDALSARCPLALYPTAEEIAKRNAEVAEYLRRLDEAASAGHCPECGPNVGLKQVGPCVYCERGHRLYQGRLPRKGAKR